MKPAPLSITEYAVLGLLAEGPAHGFAISRELERGSPLGRILTVRRPLVYRALDRLVEAGLAEAVLTEPGDAGPKRVIHRVTQVGRRRLGGWLQQPVGHLRDMRIEFQLKVAMLLRSGVPPLGLIRAQREALGPTISALEASGDEPIDHLDLWRRHSAAAAAGYLDTLEARYRQP